MKWSYDKPLTISMGPKALSIVKVRHGVTEATLSDGSLVRLSVHIDGVVAKDEASVDITHSVHVEMMDEPDLPIHDVHDRVQ